MEKKIEELNYACSLNSITLTALIEVLTKKGVITKEELRKAFDEAKIRVGDGK